MSHFHFCVEFPFKVSHSNNCNLMQIQKTIMWQTQNSDNILGFAFCIFYFAHSVYRKIFTAVLCCLIYKLFFSRICRLIWFLSMCGVMISWFGVFTWRTCRLTRPVQSHSSTITPGWATKHPKPAKPCLTSAGAPMRVCARVACLLCERLCVCVSAPERLPVSFLWSCS